MAGVEVRITDRYGCTRPERELAVRVAVAARGVGRREDVPVSLLLTDDAEIARLHGEFLGDPTETDVISFDIEGTAEVVVNVDRAAREATRRGVSRADELALYVVHGVLHVCGFDDIESEDRARMRVAEREVLVALGVRIAAVDD